MMTKNKDVSVIVVSYNTKKLLRDCLTSVFQQQGVSYEVIVVDNGSGDGSVALLRQEFPQVDLIKNRENLGFAAANNQGLARAQGRYSLLLNSDTVLGPAHAEIGVGEDKRVLAKMVEWMDQNPEVGISTCRIQAGPDEPAKPGLKFQSVGGFFPTLKKVILWMSFVDDLPGLNRQAYHLPACLTEKIDNQAGLRLDWVTGAFFFLRHEVYGSIGGFDEDFFMYVEEVEYCYRARKAGWQVAFVPVASLTHFGGGSSTSGRNAAILGEYRSLIRLYEKHFPRWQLPLVRLSLKLGALLRLVLFGYGKRDSTIRSAYRQALGLV